MRLSEFNYNLPEELIAQTPLEKRDSSRLLILDKKTGKIDHKIFYEIIDLYYDLDGFEDQYGKVYPGYKYDIKNLSLF